MLRFFKSLYLTNLLFGLLTGVIVLFVFANFFPGLFVLCIGLFATLMAALLLDIAVLYRVRKGVHAQRIAPEKLSNGDENTIGIRLENYYNFFIRVGVIDEIPFQFQRRDVLFSARMEPGTRKVLEYQLRPTKRGEYHFGSLNVYAASPLGLIRRRFNFDADITLPVYPSFLQMRKYELLAISNRLQEAGIKRLRRIGQSMEFEQIKEYVVGDDYRTVNWKATARAGKYMVNQFTEERSQPVYCIIDKGRMMKMPFEGLSLLDYAINATLVLSNIALYKQDRAGLITFSERMGILLKASRRATQMHAIQELLYKQKTRYLESNFEILYANIRLKLNHRSLVLLFTNFDSLSSMRRQLPYLRGIARSHLLVVIFFENTELRALIDAPAEETEQIYLKTVAEKFAFEKRQIVRELQVHGIQAILTQPENLTVDTLNKYLELKARGMI